MHLQVTHMPPELLTEGKLSKAADVFAFGERHTLMEAVLVRARCPARGTCCRGEASSYLSHFMVTSASPGLVITLFLCWLNRCTRVGNDDGRPRVGWHVPHADPGGGRNGGQTAEVPARQPPRHRGVPPFPLVPAVNCSLCTWLLCFRYTWLDGHSVAYSRHTLMVAAIRDVLSETHKRKFVHMCWKFHTCRCAQALADRCMTRDPAARPTCPEIEDALDPIERELLAAAAPAPLPDGSVI